MNGRFGSDRRAVGVVHFNNIARHAENAVGMGTVCLLVKEIAPATDSLTD